MKGLSEIIQPERLGGISLLLCLGGMIKINKLIKINFVFRKVINAIFKKSLSTRIYRGYPGSMIQESEQQAYDSRPPLLQGVFR